MSKVKEVLKQKQIVEKQRIEDRKNKLQTIKVEAIYKARLLEEMQVISNLLENDPKLECIIIEIPENSLTMFTRLMYTELEEFKIAQVAGKANLFEVRRRLIIY